MKARKKKTEPTKRRFAFVGMGLRMPMFLHPPAKEYRDHAEIVGLCDTSLVRARYHQNQLKTEFHYPEVPVYHARDFRKMIRETRPDEVVVATVDRYHHRYILAALEEGCDVTTEKPMTTDAGKCRQILAAAKKSRRKVRVTFNYRWTPGVTKVRQILSEGTIGRIHQVNMEYLLNTRHGAQYFQRWHSEKKYSGGLLVHKSTHHFDIINWWLNQIPETVFAFGDLRFYGRKNAIARGDKALTTYPRYLGHDTGKDPFAYRPDPVSTAVYHDAEEESGYIRDQNVFRDGITAEDVMNVVVRYRGGTLLNYSLNAFSPFEGFRVTFTGEKGRIEYLEPHGAHIVEEDGSNRPVDEHAPANRYILRVFPMFKDSYEIPITKATGGHGGGDQLLQEQIFLPNPPADPYERTAGYEQGAASILIGIAANQSIASGKPVNILDLAKLAPGKKKLGALI